MGSPRKPQNPPQILKNHQKSSKKCLPGCYFTLTLKNNAKSCEMCAFQGRPRCNPYTPVQSKHTFSFSYFCSKMHRKDLKHAPFRAPFGFLWAPKWLQMPLFRCFGRCLKHHVFFSTSDKKIQVSTLFFPVPKTQIHWYHK